MDTLAAPRHRRPGAPSSGRRSRSCGRTCPASRSLRPDEWLAPPRRVGPARRREVPTIGCDSPARCRSDPASWVVGVRAGQVREAGVFRLYGGQHDAVQPSPRRRRSAERLVAQPAAMHICTDGATVTPGDGAAAVPRRSPARTRTSCSVQERPAREDRYRAVVVAGSPPGDPGFETKAARVLDLYARTWQGAHLGPGDYVISADEKSQLPCTAATPAAHPDPVTPAKTSSSTAAAEPWPTPPPTTSTTPA
jgi:hypothetical protein